VSTDGGILQTTALDIRDGRIAAIHVVRNPTKLPHIGAAMGAGEAGRAAPASGG
jgi:RNA polymerase sigma-70 factor (ECF subfamily)